MLRIRLVGGVAVDIDGRTLPEPTSRRAWALLAWLALHLALPNGIPSRDCIRRLLIILKPEAFQRCFQAWINDTILADVNDPDRLVAIDGKSNRGSHDRACCRRTR